MRIVVLFSLVAAPAVWAQPIRATPDVRPGLAADTLRPSLSRTAAGASIGYVALGGIGFALGQAVEPRRGFDSEAASLFTFAGSAIGGVLGARIGNQGRGRLGEALIGSVGAHALAAFLVSVSGRDEAAVVLIPAAGILGPSLGEVRSSP